MEADDSKQRREREAFRQVHTRLDDDLPRSRNTAAWVLVVVLMVLAVVGVLAWSLVSGGEVEAQPATTIGQGE